MLKTHLNPSDSFKNCGVFVRIATVKPDSATDSNPDSKVSASSVASDWVANTPEPSTEIRGVATPNALFLLARSNNTPPTLYAPAASSVRIKKQDHHEKRNAYQLVAVRRMSDCNR